MPCMGVAMRIWSEPPLLSAEAGASDPGALKTGCYRNPQVHGKPGVQTLFPGPLTILSSTPAAGEAAGLRL